MSAIRATGVEDPHLRICCFKGTFERSPSRHFRICCFKGIKKNSHEACSRTPRGNADPTVGPVVHALKIALARACLLPLFSGPPKMNSFSSANSCIKESSAFLRAPNFLLNLMGSRKEAAGMRARVQSRN